MEAGPGGQGNVAGKLPGHLPAERHPVAACVLRNTMAAIALRRADERTQALRDTMSELLGMDEPRRRFAAMMPQTCQEPTVSALTIAPRCSRGRRPSK